MKSDILPEEGTNSNPSVSKPASNKPMSLINAAYRLLKEENRGMSCPEMVVMAIARGYWKPGKGKTPAQTLYAAILREQKTGNLRFVRSEVSGEFYANS